MDLYHNNPLLAESSLPFSALPFDQFRAEHFLPALEAAIAEGEWKLAAVAADSAPPSFANSVLAIEEATEKIGEVMAVYYGLSAIHSDEEFRSLAQEMGPKTSEFFARLSHDPQLFERVRQVYAQRGRLGPEERRLVELTYRGFVRSGALLDAASKARFSEIRAELSQLSPRFANNVLQSKNAFFYHTTDPAEVAGLPKAALKAARHAAQERGHDEGWGFTLQEPSVRPVLEYADHCPLRERLYRAKGRVAYGGEFDNCENAKRIAGLNYELVQLLGYPSYAAYALEQRMAGKPERVEAFLERIRSAATPAAERDRDAEQEFALRVDGVDDLQMWDSAYYGRRLKEETLALDEEQLRPYFRAERVVDGVFDVARRLYGLTFESESGLPLYHPDVSVYRVADADGSYLGLLYLDLHPRETKSGGAFTGAWRGQGMHRGEMQRPHVYIVANFTPSTSGHPSLLSLEEVRTLFHEFGHALHALLSQCTYAALAGPDVYQDFVELPSQIMENWVTEEEALALFARHHETGALVPAELVAKVRAARQFEAGLDCLRRMQFEYLDWAWFGGDPRGVGDVAEFESRVQEPVRLFPWVEGRCLSTSFEHIFAGGYAAGYYSYRWAEVLDADAFELFRERGIFNREVATGFRQEILERGNQDEPMELFRRFRGREPDPDALLRRMGLI
jgi:Zn-dependent oligopeptidase